MELEQFSPVPGVILVEPIEEPKTGFILSKDSDSRLLRGQVIKVGADLQDGASLLKQTNYAEVGEQIVYLSYEGNYDWLEIQGKKYYLVLFKDVRVRVKHA